MRSEMSSRQCNARVRIFEKRFANIVSWIIGEEQPVAKGGKAQRIRETFVNPDK